MKPTFGCHGLSLVRTGDQGREQEVLRDVSADFPPGRVTVITGPTGAGKTTLLHLLAGLMRPTRGEVRFQGEPVSRWPTAHRDRWRRRVGTVFQEPLLIDDLTVLENVILPLVPRRLGLAAMRRRGLAMLSELGLRPLAGARTARLSGGERQRTAVARALVHQPRIVLADEPTAHQDADHARLLLNALTRLPDGAVIIIVAHDPRVPAAIPGCRHGRLQNGRLEGLG